MPLKFLQVRVSLHLLLLEYQARDRVFSHLQLFWQVQLRCQRQRMLSVYKGGGGSSFYESTLREVWINGDKIEPTQASQFITRSIQAHIPGPIHRFNDFSMEFQELLYQMFMSNHRFTHRSDEAWSRLVWTTTAQSNFKHLLYNARKNAQKVSQSADPTLWRERAPTWMRRDYWESLCNIWATKRLQQTSTTIKVNQAANPDANMHTSRSVSFATHQSRLVS
ncbi:hypothetical protein Taro_036752, partial [Colocasia esculenta]|nr:hypothetical protein [Colocasia esculenta]